MKNNIQGNLTQCLAQRRGIPPLPALFPLPSPPPTSTSGRGKISDIWISQVLAGVKRGAEGQITVKLKRDPSNSNSCCLVKITFSGSMAKFPRQVQPDLEEQPRHSRKALLHHAAPLFPGIGWTCGSPTLVWLRDTLVLTHWHLQSRKCHLIDLG